ncbi:hypothetical protein [Variovorax sp. MHTC-1]|uniref:hypothetical protein n=1 Tax=Variovorax sp. MHTC-1 TaxID=2495593 RepID=UPI000F86C893|nr:hypothetical protein [Variovorax sp. MHTC-1]RST50001.1 hypothetical protein EJI01_22395 [Variovorax sp. MHTC-1]
MAKRFNTHNRFAEELDSAPSGLEELTFYRRLEEHERRAAGWRRNLSVAALAIVAVVVAIFIAR